MSLALAQDNPMFKEFQEIFQKFDLAAQREAEAAAEAAEARYFIR